MLFLGQVLYISLGSIRWAWTVLSLASHLPPLWFRKSMGFGLYHVGLKLPSLSAYHNCHLRRINTRTTDAEIYELRIDRS